MKIKGWLFSLYVIAILSCHNTKKLASGPSTTSIPSIPDSSGNATPDTTQSKNMSKTDILMEELLETNMDYFGEILSNRDSLKVQIIYTQIDRQANNDPVFKTYYFNVNPANYFYPASTVKLPIAALALQRLNELKVVGLNPHSTMITESGYSGQTPVYNDPTSEDGRPSIAQYVKKIFLVSDNDAFNRLYEFLGQQYINDQLHKMGYDSCAILHRLSIVLSEDENRHTNPVNFFSETGKGLYGQPMQANDQVYPPRNDSIGQGYFKGDSLIRGPMDFSKKNRIGLEDLTNILKSLLFPSFGAGKGHAGGAIA